MSPSTAPAPVAAPPPTGPSHRRWVPDVAVAVLILLSAALVYGFFWGEAPSLWYSTVHDRNGHYRRCLGGG